MAKRYYLCDLVEVTDPGGGVGHAPAVALVPGVNWSGVLDPANNRALVIVAAANHAAVRARPGVDPMPDAPLDRKVNRIGQQATTAYQEALARRGLGAMPASSEEYRSEVNRIGQQIDPNFDVDRLDAAEWGG